MDLLLVLGGVVGFYLGVSAFSFLVRPRKFHWPAPGALPLSLLGWTLLVLYLAIGWSGTGRTIGKQLMGLRVESRGGGHLGFGVAFGRALVCAAFPIGLFWCAISRDDRSLADLILRTRVVYDWRPRVPAGSSNGGRGGT